MRDRTPTRALENGALRYGVYAEDGSLLRYEYLALEDDPTDPGTELSKATLLQDSTEVSLFGSAADRTVDEAFAGIAGQLKLIKSDMASITLTVQDTNGKTIPEVLVQGILSESGQAVYTNANGVVTGYIDEGAQVIKVSGYADIADYSETVTVVKGTNITKTWKLTTRDFLKVTSSRSIKFSGNVSTIDFTLGAPGSGAGGNISFPSTMDRGAIAMGGAGAGGRVKEVLMKTVAANIAYSAVIGSGGISGTPMEYSPYEGAGWQYAPDGKAGGITSFMGESISGPAGGKGGSYNGATVGAVGGKGAQGNGNGADGIQRSGTSSASISGKNGTPGTQSIYKSFTESEDYGGGGGSAPIGGAQGMGGAPGGGDSGRPDVGQGTGKDGAANKGGGAGGGTTVEVGGKGGSGVIAIRMHLKSAA